MAQLRLAKNQLSTKVAQLEAVLRSTQKGRRFKPSGAAAASSSVRSAPRDAALQEPDPPQDPEVRLTKVRLACVYSSWSKLRNYGNETAICIVWIYIM